MTSTQELQQQTDELKALRQKLDAGEINVSQFIEAGKPLAQQALAGIGELASKGSKSANLANPFLAEIAAAGFKHVGGTVAAPEVNPSLPEKYQKEVRESLVPDNLDPEVRKQIINSIPTDVDIFSDAGKIERERIRQRVESEQTLTKRGVERNQKLDELSTLLAGRRDVLQKRATPQIAEQANAAGILKTTGYGDALARNVTNLEEDSAYALSQQALSDREVNMGEAMDVLNRSQDFQTSALSRDFSTADARANFDRAMKLAELSRPSKPGKTNSEKAYDGASLLIGAAGTAAKFQ